MSAESIRIEGQIREGWTPGMAEARLVEEQSAEHAGHAGHEVRVTVLRGGASSNGYY